MIAESMDVLEEVKSVRERSGKGLTERVWKYMKKARLPLLILLIIAIFCEAAWLVSLTPTETDMAHYECYGLTFWLGSHGATLLPQGRCAFLTTPLPALHMLPIEYPPLTIVAFSLPLLAPLPYYALGFALLMTLVAGLIYWLLKRSGARKAAPIFLLYLMLGAAAVAQERFDLLPAACTLICLLAVERGRWKMAYVALALGVLLKIYPIVMLPALFLAEQRAWMAGINEQGSWLSRAWENVKRWHWQNSLLFAGLLIVVMGGFALLNYHDAIVSPLDYFLQRPLQIESLGSSVIWVGSHFGASYRIDFIFGSLNVESGLASLVSPTNMLLTVAGIVFVFWLQWRKQIDFAQTMVALVCVLITTGKVFSPQYLIWLFPLLAYIYARGKTNRLWMYCWAAISLLTTFIYAGYYSRLPDPQTARQIIQTLPGFFELVAVRNLLLLGTTLAFLCNWRGTRSRRAVNKGMI